MKLKIALLTLASISLYCAQPLNCAMIQFPNEKAIKEILLTILPDLTNFRLHMIASQLADKQFDPRTEVRQSLKCHNEIEAALKLALPKNTDVRDLFYITANVREKLVRHSNNMLTPPLPIGQDC